MLYGLTVSKLPTAAAFQATMRILAKSEEQRLVFGWLYVARKADGSQVVDHSGEVVDVADLEKASYEFVLKHRVAGAMHEEIGVGRLVECIVFTAEKREAMGIPDGVLGDAMWVGFKIDDDDAWEGVRSGRYKMLSLGGKAVRSLISTEET